MNEFAALTGYHRKGGDPVAREREEIQGFGSARTTADVHPSLKAALLEVWG